MKCKICESTGIKVVGNLPLNLPGTAICTELFKCSNCGSYSRGADYSDPAVQRHFENTSYTDLRFEREFLESKRIYFDYLLDSIERFFPAKATLSLLDVGASYGHLLDQCRVRGHAAAAVELVSTLRQRLEQRGYVAYRTVEEVPPEQKFDVITFIDSLYYLEEPFEILRRASSILQEDGLLLIRIPNRTPILDAARALKMEITTSLFLDSKHNYSYKGIKILCERAGLSIERVDWRERGKKPIINEKGGKMPLVKRVYGALSTLLCSLPLGGAKYKIAPGLIFFARRIARP